MCYLHLPRLSLSLFFSLCVYLSIWGSLSIPHSCSLSLSRILPLSRAVAISEIEIWKQKPEFLVIEKVPLFPNQSKFNLSPQKCLANE